MEKLKISAKSKDTFHVLGVKYWIKNKLLKQTNDKICKISELMSDEQGSSGRVTDMVDKKKTGTWFIMFSRKQPVTSSLEDIEAINT